MKLGIAFGGGAIRALSSIGIIEYLEKKNIRPRHIAGTSMGAVIGSLFAAGFSSIEITSIIKKMSALRLLRLNTNIFEYNGIFHLENLKEFLSSYLPVTFDKLLIPISIVATDIDAGEAVYLRDGNLLDAIIASCSMPILFKPIIVEGRYLVDGGLVEQLPISPLMELDCNSIVAIWNGYLARKKPKYRGLISIGIKSIDILGKNIFNTTKYDDKVCILAPNIDNYVLFCFRSIDKIIQEGRKEAETNVIFNNILKEYS